MAEACRESILSKELRPCSPVKRAMVAAGFEPRLKNQNADPLPLGQKVFLLINSSKERYNVMKVVIWLGIERLQRIIAIQGVSLVRILNLPSLIWSVGRSIGRSGESLGRISRELRSLEILPRDSPSLPLSLPLSLLPPSLVRGGFTDPHSLAPQYYLNTLQVV